MKLGFCPSIGFILDFECMVDVDVEWDLGTPHLVVNDVFESSGKVSLFNSTDDEFWLEFAHRIMDEAEDDERLLERAVAQDNDEREAA
jgi:hypothetical protein